jgi:hypothetical protein
MMGNDPSILNMLLLDAIGQHILLFAIDGQVSNAIVVDVVSYQPPAYQPPVYRQPTAYQQSDMPPIYYGEPYAEESIIDHAWRFIIIVPVEIMGLIT